MISKVLQYAKAVIAGASAGIAVAIPAAADGHVTGTEWLGILAAVLAGSGLVAAIPNKPAAPPAP